MRNKETVKKRMSYVNKEKIKRKNRKKTKKVRMKRKKRRKKKKKKKTVVKRVRNNEGKIEKN